jgi:hypothetical protein
MLNFVSFWVPRPDHPRTTDYAECLRLQRQACERLGLRQIVITEPGALPGYETFEAPTAGLDLMRAFLVGQREYLAGPAFDADTVLTGADCLPLYDLAPVFDGGFDLAVTTHPFADCILNSGAIFCPLHARDALVAVWDAAIDGMGAAWGDDQLALAAVLKPTLAHGDHSRGGLRLRCLPCVGYNQAPDSERDMIEPLVAHFRGPRKKWMGAWWSRHLRKT